MLLTLIQVFGVYVPLELKQSYDLMSAADFGVTEFDETGAKLGTEWQLRASKACSVPGSCLWPFKTNQLTKCRSNIW